LGWVLRHLLETSRHDDAHADDFPMGERVRRAVAGLPGWRHSLRCHPL